LLREFAEQSAKNENLERSIYSKTKLLESVEEAHKKEIKKIHDDNQAVIADLKHNEEQANFEREDVQSGALRRQIYVDSVTAKFSTMQRNIETYRNQIKNLKEQIQSHEKQHFADQAELKELRDAFNDLRIALAVRDKDLADTRKQLEEVTEAKDTALLEKAGVEGRLEESEKIISELREELKAVDALQENLEKLEAECEEYRARRRDAADKETQWDHGGHFDDEFLQTNDGTTAAAQLSENASMTQQFPTVSAN
jgi:chromosome segregation ATPase